MKRFDGKRSDKRIKIHYVGTGDSGKFYIEQNRGLKLICGSIGTISAFNQGLTKPPISKIFSTTQNPGLKFGNPGSLTITSLSAFLRRITSLEPRHRVWSHVLIRIVYVGCWRRVNLLYALWLSCRPAGRIDATFAHDTIFAKRLVNVFC